MKRTSILSYTSALILMAASCKKELAPQESFVDYSIQKNNATEQKSATNTTQTIVNSTTKPNPPHGQPGHVCGNEGKQNTTSPVPTGSIQQYTISQPSSTATQSTTKVAKGMNPPHGQPGHICGIAVGAPLNSKPVATNNTATTNKTITATTTTPNNSTPALLTPTSNPQSTPVKTEAGMNPPHGQEGHVCGIAVGAPLNPEKKTEENAK